MNQESRKAGKEFRSQKSRNLFGNQEARKKIPIRKAGRQEKM
jgi:hypothetical protein